MKSLLCLFILLSLLQVISSPQDVKTPLRYHEHDPFTQIQTYLPGQINENCQDRFLKTQNQKLAIHKLGKQLNNSDNRYVPVKFESDSSERYTYSYDSKGNQTSETHEWFQNGSWGNYYRTRMTYDNNGNVVAYNYDDGNAVKGESFEWKNDAWIASISGLSLSYNYGKDQFYSRGSVAQAEYKLIGDEDPFAIHEFSLSQNYPNPFNSSTTINYSVRQDGQTILAVYNTLGKKVAVILDTYKPAGEYSVRFDGQSLPSGVYFYMLESAGNTSAKKFILLK